jgi:hypothetical protein
MSLLSGIMMTIDRFDKLKNIFSIFIPKVRNALDGNI